MIELYFQSCIFNLEFFIRLDSPTCERSITPGPTPMKFDHHLHTARHSPDSSIDPHELVVRAREIGLDGLVITEHDYQWDDDELAELAELAAPLRVFSGAEISARRATSWCTGSRRSTTCRRASSWRSCCASSAPTVRRSSLPIRSAGISRSMRSSPSMDRAFDALELVSNNVTADTRRLTEAVLRRHGMGATGSSDAHEIRHVGCYSPSSIGPSTRLGISPRRSRARRGRPRHRPGVHLSSGPVSWEPAPLAHEGESFDRRRITIRAASDGAGADPPRTRGG